VIVLTFTETPEARLLILPTSRENRPRRLGRTKMPGSFDQGGRTAERHGLLGNYAFANRVEDQFRQPPDIQLVHQIRAVALNRVHAQVQQIRDVFV